MLMTFRCNAYADITMFGEIGLQMVAMMGHSESTSGAIKAEGIPQALSKLKAALDSKKGTEDVPDDSDDQGEPAVSLANRAVPLIEMLEAAVKQECDVMWESE